MAWKPDDAVVFAAAVGADPGADLDYLDLSRGPVVLPTFLAARIGHSGREHLAVSGATGPPQPATSPGHPPVRTDRQ